MIKLKKKGNRKHKRSFKLFRRSKKKPETDIEVIQVEMPEESVESSFLEDEIIVDALTQTLFYAGKGNASFGASNRLCRVCLMVKERFEFPDIQMCGHRTCFECLQEYFRTEIMEGRTNISCAECTELIHPNDIMLILQDSAMVQRYENFMLRRVLIKDKDARWCPAPDCGYAVIAYGCSRCPKLKCGRPECGTFFCYHCRRKWHPNGKCNDTLEEFLCFPELKAGTVKEKSRSKYREYQTKGELKPCPRCNFMFLKLDDGSCNEMVCSVCGAQFCWQCMQEISDFHFFGPSGCTYYGKKAWGKKKRILWQMGILVGAPVAITFAIAVAVPTMIIGIPVWVGVKMNSHYKGKNESHKRNLAILGSVSASAVVSPIIAGLAVGFAMPGLLAYIYGVVPLSLCYTCVASSPRSPTPLSLPYDDDTPDSNEVVEIAEK